jgi:hypothetical protein
MKKWLYLLVTLLLFVCLPTLVEGTSQYRTLTVGSTGAGVAALKQRMFELGYFKTNTVNESFTTNTAEYVKEFERINGLEVDGIADPEMQALFYSDKALPKSAVDSVTTTSEPTATPAPTATLEAAVASGASKVCYSFDEVTFYITDELYVMFSKDDYSESIPLRTFLLGDDKIERISQLFAQDEYLYLYGITVSGGMSTSIRVIPVDGPFCYNDISDSALESVVISNIVESLEAQGVTVSETNIERKPQTTFVIVNISGPGDVFGKTAETNTTGCIAYTIFNHSGGFYLMQYYLYADEDAYTDSQVFQHYVNDIFEQILTDTVIND